MSEALAFRALQLTCCASAACEQSPIFKCRCGDCTCNVQLCTSSAKSVQQWSAAARLCTCCVSLMDCWHDRLLTRPWAPLARILPTCAHVYASNRLLLACAAQFCWAEASAQPAGLCSRAGCPACCHSSKCAGRAAPLTAGSVARCHGRCCYILQRCLPCNARGTSAACMLCACM